MAGTSYTRQSTIADGNLIAASLFNSEYNQLVNAFAYATTGTTGHTHDGSAGQGGAIAKIGDQDFKNKIEVSATNNRIEFYSEVGGAAVEQIRVQDGAIVPVTDSDVDLGTTSVRFKDAFVDSVTVTNNIVVAGTVDGRDVAADGTKLDGIEASATADQTDAEIRAAVEAATDSNVFTDADHTKLNAIEDSADVTDTTNVTAAGALMDSEVTNLAQVKAFDSSDYATAALGTTADAALPKSGGAMTGAITTNSTFDGRDVATDGTKLDGIEASADVTDATNVTAAGALMDSEVTNLAQVKAFDSSDYATAAQGTLAAAALPKSGGTMSGAIAMGTSKITGAGDPTAAQDVATKAYVDANIGGGGGGETLQQTLAIGNTTTTDTKIQFRDTGLYINSSADGQLDIVADTEVQIAATTVDVNGILDVSGNIVAGGTVDGVDIAARDGVLTTTTTTANAALPKSGGTVTGNISFGDNDKAVFGAGSDLEIYHDGSNSYISDTSGTGDLYLRGTNLRLTDNDGTLFLFGAANADTRLYYAGTAKIATTAAGIDVTGTATMDGLTVDGSGDLGTIGNGAFNAAAALGFQGDRAFFGYSSSQNTLIQSGASKGVVVEVNSDTLDSGTRAALFASNGDISFYEDTGTTPKFFWDASAESLGIGTSSPSETLAVESTSNNAILLNSPANRYNAVGFQSAGVDKWWMGRADTDVIAGDAFFIGADAGNATDAGGTSAKLVIDSSGNVGIGTDSPSTYGGKLNITDGSVGGESTLVIANNNANQFVRVGINDNVAQIAYDNADSLAFGQATDSTTAGLTTEHLRITSDGVVEFKAGITEDAVTLTGTSTTIDLATATNFVHDLTGATTYTFSNPATTGNATAFTLKIIQDSTARAITWPASVDWAGGTAPTLTATNNGVDVFVFYTIDGGTTYYGFTAGQAMA